MMVTMSGAWRVFRHVGNSVSDTLNSFVGGHSMAKKKRAAKKAGKKKAGKKKARRRSR